MPARQKGVGALRVQTDDAQRGGVAGARGDRALDGGHLALDAFQRRHRLLRRLPRGVQRRPAARRAASACCAAWIASRTRGASATAASRDASAARCRAAASLMPKALASADCCGGLSSPSIATPDGDNRCDGCRFVATGLGRSTVRPPPPLTPRFRCDFDGLAAAAGDGAAAGARSFEGARETEVGSSRARGRRGRAHCSGVAARARLAAPAQHRQSRRRHTTTKQHVKRQHATIDTTTAIATSLPLVYRAAQYAWPGGGGGARGGGFGKRTVGDAGGDGEHSHQLHDEPSGGGGDGSATGGGDGGDGGDGGGASPGAKSQLQSCSAELQKLAEPSRHQPHWSRRRPESQRSGSQSGRQSRRRPTMSSESSRRKRNAEASATPASERALIDAKTLCET